MNNPIDDERERTEALNPKRSFIVQAPAGSGKTELLTQRFLMLLTYVKQPEEILAITFTKKSAAEMRARIIHSLNNALHEPEPSMAHAKTTWQLAKRVLEHSQGLKWNLLDNPNRLRIQTIDSFNAYLTKQLPILSNFGATPEIIDDPAKLYREAVQEFLSHLEENVAWAESIAQLLLHMDNDLNKLQELLISMLAKRDQWLPYITLNAHDPTLREKLESHLASITTDILTTLNKIFPKHHTKELLFLGNIAAQNLIRENSSSKIIYCADLQTLPSASINGKQQWLGLSELLLTVQFEWRKRIDKTIGFPAPANTKNPEEKHFLINTKQRMMKLLEVFRDHEELLISLEDLNLSPHWQYEEIQWETLNALHQVLRIVVAQLKLVFQQHGKIDYIESAQAALTALGTDDTPTDMTLALDYQIQHILIDEFQDTSNSQYRLIEKLTAGWEANDGRTLFLVGDPMQSIYRFREAEVGLFIRARKKGLGNIKLEPLTLSVNFRSVPGVVNWINQHFQKILPAFEDIEMGAISYSPSIANKTSNAEKTTDLKNVELHPLVNENEIAQASAIIRLIQQKKALNPTETIAILVRSRTHLAAIIPALKKANIFYRAIDIDPLDTCPVIQDLMALTRALLHPADRIAWLALLRAPWCGLALSDLLIIAGHGPHLNCWERLEINEVLQQISPEGRERLARIMPILRNKIADRYRLSLRLWLESTWIALGGPASARQPSDLEDATAYFNLLEKLDDGGELPNLDELNGYVRRLYASPNNQADNTLQIMTIHNSKGLEFDTVILPHLERKSPSDEKQLLLWMERPEQDNRRALILAPVNAVGHGHDPIYDYIKRQHAIKSDYENGRLLYVAATRAKKQLHIFFSLQSDNKSMSIAKPITKSLLEKLWDSIKQNIKKDIEDQLREHVQPVSPELKLEKAQICINRLTLDWQNPVKENNLVDHITYHRKKSGFQLPENNPKYIGILIHQVLQQICRFGSSWWQSTSLDLRKKYLQNHFIQLGVLPINLPPAMDIVLTAIQNTLRDPRGQWIIKTHSAAESEFHLTAVINNKIQSLIIDRTFVDATNTRWIVDYKTAAPGSEDLSTFLHSEQQKYAKQMSQYSTAIKAIDSRLVRLGLYFPLVPAWCEWAP